MTGRSCSQHRVNSLKKKNEEVLQINEETNDPKEKWAVCEQESSEKRKY